MKSSPIRITVAILLCGPIISTVATRDGSLSERRIVSILPKEEPKVHGIFQKHGGSAELFSLPKGSSPLSVPSDTTTTTDTQLPLHLSSRTRHISHIVASIFTVFLFGSLVYCWKCMGSDHDRSNVGLILSFISVVAYFMEAATSSTARYLRNPLTPDDVDEYLDSIKAVIPRVIWDIECFHYETVQRVEYPSSSNDDKDNNDQNVPEVRTETETIVTHRASAEYSFARCKDETDTRSLSRMLTGGGTDNIKGDDSSTQAQLSSIPKQFTKITLDKLLFFANDATYCDYMEQESRFRQLHQHRDLHHSFSSRLVMDGYLPKILVVNHSLGGAGTGLIKNLWYWIFTCLGLTVPYRIWFSQHCSNTEVTITKEVSSR